MTIDAPLALVEDKVRPEWIDFNGHMNVAYYVLAFDWATDAFFDFAGIGERYRKHRGGSTFALQNNVCYLRELREGEQIRVTTRLLGLDEKRVHYFHTMYRADSSDPAATIECLSIHVDLNARKVTSFPDDIFARLSEILSAHAALPVPEEAGRTIRVGKPDPGAGPKAGG